MTQQRKREEKSWGCWVIDVTLWSIFDYSVTSSVTREQIKSDLLLPEMRWEASWAEAGSEGGWLVFGGILGEEPLHYLFTRQTGADRLLNLGYLTSNPDSFVAQ